MSALSPEEMAEVAAAAAAITHSGLARPAGEEGEEEEDEDIDMVGLSELKFDGVRFAYRRYECVEGGLLQLSHLSQFVHLQRVLVAHNQISDLAPLSPLRQLCVLDASHNRLETFPGDWAVPDTLQQALLSHNQIREITQVPPTLHFLQTLDLSNNSLSALPSLHALTALADLNVSHNQLTELPGIRHLSVRRLDVSHNALTHTRDIGSLLQLETLDASHNEIASVESLERVVCLSSADFSHNKFSDPAVLHPLSYLRDLSSLRLVDNPIQEIDSARHKILAVVLQVTTLDDEPVSAEDKVKVQIVHSAHAAMAATVAAARSARD